MKKGVLSLDFKNGKLWKSMGDLEKYQTEEVTTFELKLSPNKSAEFCMKHEEKLEFLLSNGIKNFRKDKKMEYNVDSNLCFMLGAVLDNLENYSQNGLEINLNKKYKKGKDDQEELKILTDNICSYIKKGHVFKAVPLNQEIVMTHISFLI